ncbi:unnamed protein product [Oikopleura dioica]|uniref:phosphoethanolamine N-methyltransferase n=1 Tax=Oikopleura dioica TaxID=34765 RepID=E4Y5P5_OIKDI|nr:unnamed protein product [Oikopleura dioica]
MSEQQSYDSAEFQKFLDEQQYSRNGILRYEKIFGVDFVSTGGISTTREFVKMLKLKKGQKVLDVGCGIGGSAFHMNIEYGAHVEGFDLSRNMIDIANERAQKYNLKDVSFSVEDATLVEFQEATFDVIYSRDTILHIADKLALFKQFCKWLKPGGTLMISDYCCTPNKWSKNYSAYVAQRGYNLLSVKDYGKTIGQAGFVDVQDIDYTSGFIEILKGELELFATTKEDFIKEFSEKDYDAINGGWSDKVERCTGGDQKWGLLIARKRA